MNEWVGKTRDDGPSDIVVEQSLIQHWCEATENANPIYWDAADSIEITGEQIAPPTMLSVWMRPLTFKPGRTEIRMPLSLHFDLKEAFGLPEGIVAWNEIQFGRPVRVGDRISTSQTVREIGEERTNRLGTGRSWIIDVTYKNQDDEIVGVESYSMFAYRRTAS
ncbi:MAG: MaoC family dehydratase [Actinomycetota bacterium]